MFITYSDQAFEALESIVSFSQKAQPLALKLIQEKLATFGDIGGVHADVTFTVDDDRYRVCFSALIDGLEMHVYGLRWQML